MTFDVTPYLNNKNSDYSPLLSVMKKWSPIKKNIDFCGRKWRKCIIFALSCNLNYYI